jgi:hypothetical protein
MYIRQYEPDWDKINTIDDLKLLLEVVGLTIQGWHPQLPKIQHLLKPKSQQPLLGTWRNEFGET